jgi:hypothetical protein
MAVSTNNSNYNSSSILFLLKNIQQCDCLMLHSQLIRRIEMVQRQNKASYDRETVLQANIDSDNTPES